MQVSQRVVDQLVFDARTAQGREIVGLLVAPSATAGDSRSWMLWPLVNRSQTPERTFTVPAEELARNLDEAESMGLAPVAVYHSHPTRPASPSHSDIAAAFWPNHFIISPNARPGRQVRFWRIEGGAAAEEPLGTF